MTEEKLLLLVYVYLAGRNALDSCWWKCLYWIGAFIITLAVVKGISR